MQIATSGQAVGSLSVITEESDGQLPRETVVRMKADALGCVAAGARLIASLEGLTDSDVRRASLLPDWTIGHVLTHLARNADAFTQMLQGALRAEVVAMYPSMQARSADIESGASRSAEALVDDVCTSTDRLDQQWSTATEAVWRASGLTFAGTVPMTEVPWRRWREVEVHHSDLGLGFTFTDWSPGYVRSELPRMQMLWASRQPMGLTVLPDAALAAAPAERLAWLMGRTAIDGLSAAGLF